MIEQLLQQMGRHGIELWLEGEKLRFRAPKGALTAALRQELKTHKAAIIEHLKLGVIRPIPNQPHYPLSPAQWRLWVLLQMEGNNAAYNVPLHQLIEGELNKPALVDALHALIARHEALRTGFILVNSEPFQEVQSALDFVVAELDVSDEAAPEEAVWALSLADAQRPFELTKAPLLRATLVRLAPQKHALLLTLHHIICDGLSIGLINAEVAALYNAFCENRPNPLSPLPIQYRDYAVWLNRWLPRDAATVSQKFWLEKLGGELPVLNLPTDYARPAVQTFEGREYGVHFDAALLAQLKQLARQEGVTLFMLLLATLNVLLHRYSKATDIVIGSPVAARPLPELYDQIGFYLNTLALRSDVSAEIPFNQLLKQTKKTVTTALDHQLYPFDALVSQLNLRRDLSHAPLFDVMLTLQNQRDDGFQLGALNVTTIYQHPETSKVDLTFNFSESVNGLHLGIEYNVDLFSAQRIERMGRHWQTVLRAILTDSECVVGRLGVLDSAEKNQLQQWNQTAQPYNLDHLLPQRFEAQVAATPNQIALTCGTQSWDYATLNNRANQVAQALQKKGVRRGDCVGLAATRSLEMVSGLLGILKAGAAYVPIDPTYPADRVAYMLESAARNGGINTLVTQTALRDQFKSTLDVLLLDQISESPCDNLLPLSEPDDLAYIIFTSGSTGKPKGVQIKHNALVNFLLGMQDRLQISAHDHWLALTTISFDIATLELYLPLLVGATVVIATEEEAADGNSLANLLTMHNITLMQATPATWRLLLMAGWKGVQTLKILSGGEALPQPLAAELLPRGAQVWNLYGPTEATVWASTHQVTIEDVSETNKPVTIGKPLANTTCHILDTQGQAVPIGVVGDLYIGGVQLAKGYLNRPNLTQERFINHPLGRLYKTGDLARYHTDGTIEFLGRDDFQVKVRGFRIELGEVEAWLSQHEAINHVVVVVREDQLVAYVVENRPITPDDLRHFLNQFLPAYMIPSLFIPLDALPLTLNGKVNRDALPVLGEPITSNTLYTAPETALETEIATIWQTVLGVERVGIHDDFFNLGGHSLNGMRIVAKIQQEQGVSLSLMDLFRQPTIAALAQQITTQQETDRAEEEIETEVAPMSAEVAPMSAEVAPMSAEVAPMSAEVAPMSAEELSLLMGFEDEDEAEIAPMSAEVAPMSAEVAPMSAEELSLLMGFEND